MTFSDLTFVVSCLISPISVVHQLKLLEKLNNSDELCGICVHLVTKQQYSSDPGVWDHILRTHAPS